MVGVGAFNHSSFIAAGLGKCGLANWIGGGGVKGGKSKADASQPSRFDHPA